MPGGGDPPPLPPSAMATCSRSPASAGSSVAITMCVGIKRLRCDHRQGRRVPRPQRRLTTGADENVERLHRVPEHSAEPLSVRSSSSPARSTSLNALVPVDGDCKHSVVMLTADTTCGPSSTRRDTLDESDRLRTCAASPRAFVRSSLGCLAIPRVRGAMATIVANTTQNSATWSKIRLGSSCP